MNRVLLIKRAALGDILMATPLIRQLKLRVPGIQLDFLVGEQFAGALKHNQYIDSLITLPAETFSLRKIFTLLKFAIGIRGKYDYVFILDKHYYFNFIGRIISKNTVGYVREKISCLFLRYGVKYHDVMRYHGWYYLDLLKASKLALPDYTDYKLDFMVSVMSISYVEELLRKYALSKNEFVIIINSGGNNQFESGGIRMLPENKIIQLINNVATKVVLLGGAVDKINYNNYLNLSQNTHVYNLAGQLSLEQSAALMTYAHKIYTTDCGAMHIAISQGLFAKMCCFFGPTWPQHVLPPNMAIEYCHPGIELFNKDYPLRGKLPRARGFFVKLDMDKFRRETKKLY